MNHKIIQQFKNLSKRLIINRLIPRRKPSRLEGKVQNMGIRLIRKIKKR